MVFDASILDFETARNRQQSHAQTRRVAVGDASAKSTSVRSHTRKKTPGHIEYIEDEPLFGRPVKQSDIAQDISFTSPFASQASRRSSARSTRQTRSQRSISTKAQISRASQSAYGAHTPRSSRASHTTNDDLSSHDARDARIGYLPREAQTLTRDSFRDTTIDGLHVINTRSARSTDVKFTPESPYVFETAANEPRAALRSYTDEPEDKTDSRSAQTPKTTRTSKARKARARRAYDAYEARQPRQTPEGGPRAAVYQTQMGHTHKKSARMKTQQDERAKRASRARTGASARVSSQSKTSNLPAPIAGILGFLGQVAGVFGKAGSGIGGFFLRFSRVVVALAVCAIIGCIIVYPSAKNYYVSVRDYQKTQAEQQALEAYHASLQTSIDALSTDEGVEDRAREQFGWVKEGDNAVIVAGLPLEDVPTGEVETPISKDAVKAPVTWYSGVLDPLFGYAN